MEKKDNSGVLFRNTNKGKETQPDWKGSCKVGGVDYFLSMWQKDAKSGAGYFSLAFTEANKRNLDITKGLVKPDLSNKTTEFLDDDLPWN